MKFRKIFSKMYGLLERKQKLSFIFILLIMAVSAVLTQFTPKAIGWLTDDILKQSEIAFFNIVPVLVLILVVTVVNELLKIARRVMVEDTATKTEKKARGLVLNALLRAPLSYFKENMTGNIHGRLNRCLDGTVKLQKLIFMDFAPAIFNSIAAIIVIITTLPAILAFPMLLVVPIGNCDRLPADRDTAGHSGRIAGDESGDGRFDRRAVKWDRSDPHYRQCCDGGGAI